MSPSTNSFGCFLNELVGSSPAMCRVRDQLARLGPFPWSVRIEGPTGSGKQVAARALHDVSPRKRGPFVECYLNAVDDALALSMLCGHVKGAFTGADADRPGAVELAHGGTLFLDEVGSASVAVQVKLLQLIQERRVQRVGDHRSRAVDVRFVFATNVDLADAVQRGKFLAELYFRMGELVCWLPPLVEHLEDIPELVAHLLSRLAAEAGIPVPMLTRQQLEYLMSLRWPGNVRQLGKYLECYIANGEFPASDKNGRHGLPWKDVLDEALAGNDGNISAVARELGKSRTTIYKHLRGGRRGSGGGERHGTSLGPVGDPSTGRWGYPDAARRSD